MRFHSDSLKPTEKIIREILLSGISVFWSLTRIRLTNRFWMPFLIRQACNTIDFLLLLFVFCSHLRWISVHRKENPLQKTPSIICLCFAFVLISDRKIEIFLLMRPKLFLVRSWFPIKINLWHAYDLWIIWGLLSIFFCNNLKS